MLKYGGGDCFVYLADRVHILGHAVGSVPKVATHVRMQTHQWKIAVWTQQHISERRRFAPNTTLVEDGGLHPTPQKGKTDIFRPIIQHENRQSSLTNKERKQAISTCKKRQSCRVLH